VSKRHINVTASGGFFDKFSRGWEFAKISYGILWDFKQLIVFPVLSSIAGMLVFASYILPLYFGGTIAQWHEYHADTGKTDPYMYAAIFCFYFCSTFVIVFFNTALTACAMKVTAGETPTIGYGLSVAVKRIPQIAAWALLSAVIGLLLKIIENSSKKVGAIVSALIGSAWTVVTYFVVPVLCVEGVGPFTAVKRSFMTIKETWGEGLIGNAAMGLVEMLITLPVYLVLMVVAFFGMASGSVVPGIAGFGLLVMFMLVHAAASSAAGGIFRALLYNFATGRSMPADIDEDVFATAFALKG